MWILPIVLVGFGSFLLSCTEAQIVTSFNASVLTEATDSSTDGSGSEVPSASKNMTTATEFRTTTPTVTPKTTTPPTTMTKDDTPTIASIHGYITKATNKGDNSYIDAFVKRRQTIEIIFRLACQTIKDDNENFVEPTSCMKTNLTEKGCLSKGCCYLDDKENEEPVCIKQQPATFIYSKLDELSLDDKSGIMTKQTNYRAFMDGLINCIRRDGKNCPDTVFGLEPHQVRNLIFNAMAGVKDAVSIIRKGGLKFLSALHSAGYTTQNEFNTLRSLFHVYPTTTTYSVNTPYPTYPNPSSTYHPTLTTEKPRCFWYPWGGWGKCEGVCGTGSQMRIRRCQHCIPGTGQCQGDWTYRRACSSPVGRVCAYWGGWSGYSQCSLSCGVGTRTRKRRCFGGEPGQEGCSGEDTQSLPCNTGLTSFGRYLPWTLWSACTLSCGSGTQSRTRQHTCLTSNTEARDCNTQACCGRYPWSGWTECSTTCGRGTKTRRRSDICPNISDDVESITCNLGSGNYGDWTPWGGCSSSCSGGTQTRQRGHSCLTTTDTESRSCGGPGAFSQWTSFGPCSSSCPGGQAVRTRRHSCTNVQERDVTTCGNEADYSPWGEFSACSSTCVGTRTKRQFNPCGLAPRTESQPCGSNGDYGVWGPWSICSQSCIGGRQVRRKVRVCTGEHEEQTQQCGSIGSWGVYSPWTACDRTCGSGQQFRTRLHSCPSGLPENERGNGREARACTIKPCCNFSDWSTWSACTTTCGYGIVTRQRVNTCKDIAANVERRYCFISNGGWTTWGEWGQCSQSCPGGRRTRTRTHTCTGATQPQSSFCGNDPGYGAYGQFSRCSRSCGGGFMTRTRVHICRTLADERDVQPCNTDPGRYSEPSAWSACSRTCQGGSQVRTATHTCGLPVQVERRDCGSPGTYLTWGNWGTCSSTCTGTRVRIQRHQCTAEINQESEACGSDGGYAPWGLWTACSSSCAGGSQTRRRRHLCNPDTDTETRPCGRSGFYGDWAYFGPCTQTCGGGTQSRVRKGFCGLQDQNEARPCGTAICCFVQEWNPWTPCSVSCGIGQQNRPRFSTCSPNDPVDSQVQTCNAGNGVTSQWTQWTPCTQTCGSGTQTRRRTNTCASQAEIVSKECNNARCPYWSAWTTWSTCSATCFQGTRSRNRDCILGTIGVGCLGVSSETLPCSFGDGVWQDWGAWTRCSVTCGGGFHTRRRDHTCELEPDMETRPCNTFPGNFGLWSQWTSCTRTCGGGTRGRRRIHSCSGAVELAEENCNLFAGSWITWTAWSVCSATCGGGVHTRRRSHTCGLEDEVETGMCNTFSGSYSAWSPWSRCSVTCGGSTQTRSRSHSCGLESQIDVKECGTPLCPYWTGWTAFGECSVSCGSGFRTRNRDCQDGTLGMSGCSGEYFQRSPCDVGQGTFSQWTQFTACSATCNGGYMTRERKNTCEQDPQRETMPCNTQPGDWNAWEQWTPCPVTCGGGQQSRRRTHTCDLNDEYETRACNTNTGFWGSWSPWSQCSATCGFGFNNRERTQSCTGERVSESRSCQLNPCAIWGGWSNWGPCSSSCGIGLATRSRQCQGGTAGSGFCFTNIVGAIDSRNCDSGPCCNFDWSGWSACCRPDYPQSNTSMQLRYLGNGCGKPWQEFNRTCPDGLKILETPCTNLEELFETADHLGLRRQVRSGRVRRHTTEDLS